ncbi:PP2C-like domain-containing protein CG9801 [Trichonephila inaurata madagascariensis]|uniref:PP2C-like domain-containing protein CG9801 n=1 Tax=Trichonephila inaurata madagascariensis TaxID=2747483 RepID=A0A8X7BNX4_9ARAC|nr:PP2C-like domain-containing protein CG9801 [Trichonephila inaurata madagascariensis]
MPTFREKVGGFLRQLSTGQEKKTNYKSPCTSPTSTGSFIHKYLLGEVKKYHPEVLYGKSYYDLPVREIAPLSGKVLSACTGPQGGLTTVDLDAKPFEFPDADVHFIDEDHRDSSENLVKFKDLTKEERQSSHHNDIEPWPDVEQSKHKYNSNPEQKTEEIAGIKDWFSPCESAYGIATTLYECHPVTKENAGNPIADAFAVVMRENSALLVLADGVNWGEKSCLAARCAIHGCVNYLNKVLYREGAGDITTLDIFISLLRSFSEAHNLILQENGTLTTLCAVVVAQLKKSSKFIACACNVGDSLAYIYSPKYGVREITQGSHDIYSMRDMRDALGALGPVDGINPELSNLTVSMSELDPDDIVFLASDGISDNFDPVVGKFAIPRKVEKRAKTPTDTTIDNARGSNPIATMNVQSEKEIFAIDLNLPVVEAHQRHELTLLRMEDLIINGVNEGDGPCKTAQEICEQMIDFAEKLTIAKRRILEDPDLYKNDDLQVNQAGQRMRRRKVGEKLSMVPGKLDHASIVAYTVGVRFQEKVALIAECESYSDLKC